MDFAVHDLETREADEEFVFVISDANLARYGISTSQIAKKIKLNPKVKVFVIFIASLWNEAEKLENNLPVGHAAVCLNTSQLPKILKRQLTQIIKWIFFFFFRFVNDAIFKTQIEKYSNRNDFHENLLNPNFFVPFKFRFVNQNLCDVTKRNLSSCFKEWMRTF